MNKNLLGVSIIASITIWVIALLHYSFVEGPKHHHQNGATETQIQSAPDNFRLVCPPFQKGQTISPDMCERDDNYQRRHEKQIADHDAQISMRDAAWAAFGATLIGLILIWRTLVHTRNASDLTKEALQTTKDTSYKELRAYLGVTVTIPIHQPNDKEDRLIAAQVQILNFGQTPAYNVRFEYTFSNTHVHWNTQDSGVSAILNPTEGFTPLVEGRIDRKNIKKDEIYFLLFDIFFTDMNGQERWLKFKFSKEGKTFPYMGTTIHPGRRDGPKFSQKLVGNETMNLVSMETSDLLEHKRE